MFSKKIQRILPFLDWFHNYSISTLRADIISGLTVALVLVPQSMAYAQLAGLPAYYGLYAAFLPPMVAALFGSSRQLATGPVAVVSLMTATALEPLATAGSESYIAYAILLALLVGVFQLLLGVLRLGLVVNFLSHPVVNGFTNAAALIIASSQLSKLFGIYVDKEDLHYQTMYKVGKAALSYTHWPTLGLAVAAFVIMIVLRRINPRIPNVLIAVVVTTLISWSIGFERNCVINISQIQSSEVHHLISSFNETVKKSNEIADRRVELNAQYASVVKDKGKHSHEAIRLFYEIEIATAELDKLQEQVYEDREKLRQYIFSSFESNDGTLLFYDQKNAPSDKEPNYHDCRLKIGNNPLDPDALTMIGGGAVIGNIPSGLPAFRTPRFDWSTALNLFPMAMIISLLGFMEAISIAKAMAAKTGQRLDPNQELIGQGLANIVGSFGQSYAVSGSFSRSAVNLQAGAVTGLSNVFSSMVVIATLLFFTPLLYHLPQSVLAAIIMMAVVGLLNVKAFIHAWRAQKSDGIIGVITFVGTLLFAPHLDRGIIIGVVLSLLVYLIRNMKPAMAMLSLHPDGTFRNLKRFNLRQCPHIAIIRYAGSVFFANVSYLENKVLETVQAMPELKHVVIVGNGINELDASGEEALAMLIHRLKERGLNVSITGLNDVVLDVMRRTGLLAEIGEENFYRNAARAVASIWKSAHEESNETDCPLKSAGVIPLPVATDSKRNPKIDPNAHKET